MKLSSLDIWYTGDSLDICEMPDLVVNGTTLHPATLARTWVCSRPVVLKVCSLDQKQQQDLELVRNTNSPVPHETCCISSPTVLFQQALRVIYLFPLSAHI